MSFWIPVLHFLRQMRVLEKGKAFVMRYELPDFVFLILLSAFPFFQLFRHPTLWMLPICVFLLLASLIHYVKQEKIELDVADFLVLLFLLLQISTTLTGFGRAVDAMSAAVLTSVWFSARHFCKGTGMEHLAFFSTLALFAVSLVGIVEYLFGAAELRWVDAHRFGDIGGRVTSLFSNPNILGVYLILYFPISLWSTFSPKNTGWLRWFYAATTALCTVCVLLTWSRGAWLGLVLECFLFLLFYSKKSRVVLLCLPPLALLSLPLLPQNFRGRLFSIGDLGESSIRYRLQTWSGTWKLLGQHPFGIGVGERAWRTVYPHYAVSGTATVMHAHNVFLQVATELGVLGIFVFLLLIGFGIYRGWRQKNTVALAAVSGAVLMGMFDHLWYYPGMLVPFFSMLAFCASNRQKVTKKSCFVDILHEN